MQQSFNTIELNSPNNSEKVKVLYQSFGQNILEYPVVLICHPLTANSNVTGEGGWWKDIVGKGKSINLDRYAVISLNVPGNGFGGSDNTFEEEDKYHTGDIAAIFYEALQKLGIKKLFAAIGGSIGAGIIWELATLYPVFIERLIPVGGNWKSSDWVIGNTYLQRQILNHSSNPIEDARVHAMLTYRTPKALKVRFKREKTEEGIFKIEDWLSYHGKALKERFSLRAYKMMNYLLGSIDITRNGESFEEIVVRIRSKIYILSIDSDMFFTTEEDEETYERAKKVGVEIDHRVLHSIYGHDAFLMESEKLNAYFKTIF